MALKFSVQLTLSLLTTTHVALLEGRVFRFWPSSVSAVMLRGRTKRRGELTSVKPQIIKSPGRETSPLWRAGDGGERKEEEGVEKEGLKNVRRGEQRGEKNSIYF